MNYRKLYKDYYGIDFVFDNGKAVFNELEDAVGARMVYANTEIDIIGMYIDYIKGSLRSQIKDKWEERKVESCIIKVDT